MRFRLLEAEKQYQWAILKIVMDNVKTQKLNYA